MQWKRKMASNPRNLKNDDGTFNIDKYWKYKNEKKANKQVKNGRKSK